MNQQKNIVFFGFLLVASSTYAIQDVNLALKKRVDDASAMGLYQVLEGAKIVAFSKDYLIKGGLEEKDLKNWNEITLYANQLVNSAVENGTVPASYRQYLTAIQEASIFFQQSVDIMHNNYATLGYDKSKDAMTVNVGSTTFSPDALAEIKKIVDGSTLHKQTMRDLNNKMFKVIMDETVWPKSWTEKFHTKSGALKDADDVLSSYKKIIKSYETEKDFKRFLQNQKINTLAKAQKFVEDLYGVEYIMETKLLAKTDEKRAKNLKSIQEIREKTRLHFPSFISALEFAKLGETTDKVSMIIFQESGTYEAVFGQLGREALALYNTAQKKPTPAMQQTQQQQPKPSMPVPQEPSSSLLAQKTSRTISVKNSLAAKTNDYSSPTNVIYYGYYKKEGQGSPVLVGSLGSIMPDKSAVIKIENGLLYFDTIRKNLESNSFRNAPLVLDTNDTKNKYVIYPGTLIKDQYGMKTKFEPSLFGKSLRATTQEHYSKNIASELE